MPARCRRYEMKQGHAEDWEHSEFAGVNIAALASG